MWECYKARSNSSLNNLSQLSDTTNAHDENLLFAFDTNNDEAGYASEWGNCQETAPWLPFVGSQDMQSKKEIFSTNNEYHSFVSNSEAESSCETGSSSSHGSSGNRFDNSNNANTISIKNQRSSFRSYTPGKSPPTIKKIELLLKIARYLVIKKRRNLIGQMSEYFQMVDK